jgi:hypothetical protein
MPEAVRVAPIAFSLTFITVDGYYRIQSQRAGERLDSSKEGWAILIGIRLLGPADGWVHNGFVMESGAIRMAAHPVSAGVRWVGVAGFACAAGWLIMDVPHARAEPLPTQ